MPDRIALEMAKQGWDKPIPVQLFSFFAKMFQGDLGESFFHPGEDITEGLLTRMPATIELTLAALLLAIPLGITAGVAAAVWRNRFPDFLCMSGSMVGISIPVFFLGICLMSIFTGLPSGGRMPVDVEFDSDSGLYILESIWYQDWELAGLLLAHICLPAFALSSIPMAIIARVTRSSMLEVLSADYIRTARSKGCSVVRVVLRHAFPNAAVPVTNICAFQVGLLLSGAVLTESVFSWPGLGTYLAEGVQNSDYSVVQGGALVVAGLFVTINLILDVVYVWLDPRIRLEGREE